VTPNTRPFRATDPDISFPFQTAAKIPSWLLVFCSVIIPGVVIALLSLTVPSNTQSYAQSFRTAQGWKRRLYCLNTAWLGLGLSIATAILITNGLKNLLGRPRPDLLSRCNLNQDDIDKFSIGQNHLLDWRICRNRNVAAGTISSALDESDVRDGFRAFPSGHCSSLSPSPSRRSNSDKEQCRSQV
jgi:membrane-associated phospholipid phosphatase